tara:strand:- start:4 stop:303 length:300 start_codon:yes stop_codon:yes gene_type:complete
MAQAFFGPQLIVIATEYLAVAVEMVGPLTEALVQMELIGLMAVTEVEEVYMVHLELPVDLVAMVALPEGEVAVVAHKIAVMLTLVPVAMVEQEKFGFGL